LANIQWVLENAAGWTVGFLRSFVDNEHGTVNESPLGINKRKFCDYAMSFSIIAEAVRFSRLVREASRKAVESGDEGCRLLEFGQYRELSWRDIWLSKNAKHQSYVNNFILPKKDCRPGTKMFLFREYCLRQKDSEAQLQKKDYQPETSTVASE
jgi:hypothetical protein